MSSFSVISKPYMQAQDAFQNGEYSDLINRLGRPAYYSSVVRKLLGQSCPVNATAGGRGVSTLSMVAPQIGYYAMRVEMSLRGIPSQLSSAG